jgi:hypothetical protein
MSNLKIVTGADAENAYGFNFLVIDTSVPLADWEGQVAAFNTQADAEEYVRNHE